MKTSQWESSLHLRGSLSAIILSGWTSAHRYQYSCIRSASKFLTVDIKEMINVITKRKYRNVSRLLITAYLSFSGLDVFLLI